MPSFMLTHSCRRRRYSALFTVPLAMRGRSGSLSSGSLGSAPRSGVGLALAELLRVAVLCLSGCLRPWPMTAELKLTVSMDRVMARAVNRAQLKDLFITNLLG